MNQLNEKSGSRPISYLNLKLVGGALYERAIYVWACSVYRLVAHTSDDRLQLPHTVGTDPEMRDRNRYDFKKAQSLAKIYILCLTPAVH
jgi:hypothetical protein